MAIVATYTRDQWERLGGWQVVEASLDGVVLLFRTTDDPEADVLPVEIRCDPATGQPWPEDAEAAADLQPIPFRYYGWDDDVGGWQLEDTGTSMQEHRRLWKPRPGVDPTKPLVRRPWIQEPWE